jgi:dTDP-4-amino-4,6-dideoxygalactose transaminase
LACLALGVGPGDEVIVPSLTFVAAANAVALAGGRPVLADATSVADPSIDPNDVERRISPATRGVMCMHYGGQACALDRLLEICERHGLFLIEDAAHAPGACWNGQALGTLGDVGCFSFFGNKNMTTGEGGMALAREERVLERIRLLRSHGMTSTSWDRYRGHAHDYDVVGVGSNYRMAELPAAVGRVQLRKLRTNNRRRAVLLQRYRERLSALEGVHMPLGNHSGAAHLAVAVLEEASSRDQLRAALSAAGIQTSLHYPPIHLFERYAALGRRASALPVTEELAARMLTLPLYASLSLEQVDEVCDRIEAFVCVSSP